MNLKKIDTENNTFYDEVVEDVDHGKLTIKDILGFNVEGAPVFVPRVPCRHINPPSGYCPATNDTGNSIFSLAPVYDTIIYPIPKTYENLPVNGEIFEKLNNISLDNFLRFVEQKRVIPYFNYSYSDYDETFIKKFLEPGLPRISKSHFQLVSRVNTCTVVGGDCNKCRNHHEKAIGDIKSLIPKDTKEAQTEEAIQNCGGCLTSLYSLGINREAILNNKSVITTVCALKDIVVSRNMNAVVKSNCRVAKEALGSLHRLY